MNLLFLFTDQQRTDTLSCYGNDEVKTPSVDRLARSGVRFDRAYTPNAVCTPARASLLTGLMPHKHGVLVNFERNIGYPEHLNEQHTSFSALLREAGYRVGLEGKWHVSPQQPPSQFGFEAEHFPGFWNPYDHPEYLSYLQEHGLPSVQIKEVTRGVLPNGKPSTELAGIFAGPLEATFEYFLAHRTIRKLREFADNYHTSGQPFYLACHWFGPHLPYVVPQQYYDYYDPELVQLPPSFAETFAGKPKVQEHYSKYWTFDSYSAEQWKKLIAVYRGYARMIDDLTAMILDEVERLGLDDSTAIFFSTDHGEFTGAHKLNDKGPAMYEDIYRIPLIVRLPDGVQDAVNRQFVSLVDVTATFLDLAGVPIPESYDGQSLLPLLRGEEVSNWREHIVCEFHGQQFPYPQRMIRDERYKLIVTPADVNELYDL